MNSVKFVDKSNCSVEICFYLKDEDRILAHHKKNIPSSVKLLKKDSHCLITNENEVVLFICIESNDIENTAKLAALVHNAVKNFSTPTIAINLDLEKTSLVNFANFLSIRNYYVSELKSVKPESILFEIANSFNLSEKDLSSSKWVNFARTLSTLPANIIDPKGFVERIKCLSSPNLEIEILDHTKLKDLGLNLILAVSQGSEKSPYMVVLKYQGNKQSNEFTAFVGKGVCFDSGGLFIKGQKTMPLMKFDKSAAASVVGAISLLAEQNSNGNYYGVIGLVENMPDGNATRPSDVVKTALGDFVEISDTDAEGRLVLADCAYYADAVLKASNIITLGTLTSDTIMCLTDLYAGLFTDSEPLKNKLLRASEISHDKLWLLPYEESHKKKLDSDIADIKNWGSNEGGDNAAAAKFINHFVRNADFAHLDIAGVAFNTEETIEKAKGATGYGVDLLSKI